MRRRGAAIAAATVITAAAPRIRPRRRTTSRGSQPVVRAETAGGVAGSSAGTSTSVSTPQTIMLWPISRPSSSRLGKSTTARP